MGLLNFLKWVFIAGVFLYLIGALTFGNGEMKVTGAAIAGFAKESAAAISGIFKDKIPAISVNQTALKQDISKIKEDILTGSN